MRTGHPKRPLMLEAADQGKLELLATAYRWAITLEEGFTIACASLGCIASSEGAWQTAIASRRGRGINPISC
jgi:hypothetical protein